MGAELGSVVAVVPFLSLIEPLPSVNSKINSDVSIFCLTYEISNYGPFELSSYIVNEQSCDIFFLQ